MATKFGLGQIGNESPQWAKNIANGAIMLFALTTFIISPMPTEWISNEIKVYILTVTGSGGLLKLLEKMTGKTEE